MTASPHDAPSRVFGLDLLRAIAIAAVMISHGRIFLQPHIPALEWFHLGGFFGVELFFVLSGFLIGGILLKLGDRLSSFGELINFYKRRWWRTLPNYFLFLTANVLIALWLGTKFSHEWFPYLVFGQNLAWAPLSPLFQESWSLSVEEWFYLLVPVVFFILLNCRVKLKPAYFCTALLFLIAPMVLRTLLREPSVPWDSAVRKVVTLRLDAIMYGVLAAAACRYSTAIWQRGRWWFTALGAIVLIATASAYYTLDRNNSYFARTFLFSCTSLGFALFLPICEQWRIAATNRSWLPRFIQWVALWSYSLYLCHFSIRTLLRQYFKDWYSQSFTGGMVIWLAFLGLSFLIASTVYRFYEKPLTDMRDRKAHRPSPAVPATEMPDQLENAKSQG